MIDKKVSIILPTYNERENIGKLLAGVRTAMGKTGLRYEVLVIDDNSTDGTGEAVKKIASQMHARLISRKSKLGIGAAYKKGVEESSGQIVVTMDADLSHDPAVIPLMLREIEHGNDIVIGSRYVRGGEIEKWSIHRRTVSKIAGMFAKLLLGLKTNDLTTGYRAYTKSALRIIKFNELTSDGYSILMEAVFRAERANLRIREIPITFYDRKGGRSKLSFKEQLKYIMTVFRLKLS